MSFSVAFSVFCWIKQSWMFIRILFKQKKSNIKRRLTWLTSSTQVDGLHDATKRNTQRSRGEPSWGEDQSFSRRNRKDREKEVERGQTRLLVLLIIIQNLIKSASLSSRSWHRFSNNSTCVTWLWATKTYPESPWIGGTQQSLECRLQYVSVSSEHHYPAVFSALSEIYIFPSGSVFSGCLHVLLMCWIHLRVHIWDKLQ